MGALILIDILLVLYNCIGVALVESIYAFIIGVRIMVDKQALSIPATIANIFLAINLCEPLLMFLLGFKVLWSSIAMGRQELATLRSGAANFR